jgi:hypothetical protein
LRDPDEGGVLTMRRAEVKNLFYITHVENVDSIIRRGILAHSVVECEGVPFMPIYDEAIVANRRAKSTPAGTSLWHYANLYFQPRNPMLYRVICEKDKNDIAVISVRHDVLNLDGVVITDGNAANAPTLFYSVLQGMKQIRCRIVCRPNLSTRSTFSATKRWRD